MLLRSKKWNLVILKLIIHDKSTKLYWEDEENYDNWIENKITWSITEIESGISKIESLILSTLKKVTLKKINYICHYIRIKKKVRN